jgi:prepilin peptidase CpaA
MIWQSLVVPTLILSVATITDVKTRKIYNTWIIAAIFLALISSYAFYDLDGLKQGALAAGASLILTLPLVIFGVLGAGDMKLLFALGLTTTYQAIFTIIILSFLWGAVIGITYAIRKGHLKKVITNTVLLMTPNKPEQSQLDKIPFTVPLAFAWITYVAKSFMSGGSFSW